MNEDQCPDYKETISKLAANATPLQKKCHGYDT
jgi:hypothetical protein